MIYKRVAHVGTMDPVEVLSERNVLPEWLVAEIRHGAQVIVPDDGALYGEWHELGKERIWCEHASNQPVFDVHAVTGSVLVGTTNEGHTWFQWERSACCTCSHCTDWLRFVCTRKNQGPRGSSARTDANPIRLECIHF